MRIQKGTSSDVEADLSKIDTSILSIQEKTKKKISLFERSNKKIDDLKREMLRRKWHGYSLASDLANKLKVDEWKTNPNFNKFSRKVSSKKMLR